jgi:hypothetical protein
MQFFKTFTKTKVVTLVLVCLSLIFLIYILFLLISNTSATPTIKQDIIVSYPALNLPKSDKFILLGDSGTGEQPQYEVSNGISKYCSDDNCKSMFILGDVIYEKGVTSVNDTQFTTKFKEPYKNIKLPIYIVFGNHDYLGCIDCYLKFISDSPKWLMPAGFFLFNFCFFFFFFFNNVYF